eukprot:CAMPEP_0114139564 /NCGR_PEP_ID=MMETSP0043_2-20121206/16922_1 /TAXON_ID=464988 /ORGANISM="Hemiselmis andersenii, Strain CCMP644" /LENGTH=190 /DNA_ID=CAMNT_0001233607 /DNA_START=36 /DNA_END=605 /DNA_ORIENTATION=+
MQAPLGVLVPLSGAHRRPQQPVVPRLAPALPRHQGPRGASACPFGAEGIRAIEALDEPLVGPVLVHPVGGGPADRDVVGEREFGLEELLLLLWLLRRRRQELALRPGVGSALRQRLLLCSTRGRGTGDLHRQRLHLAEHMRLIRNMVCNQSKDGGRDEEGKDHDGGFHALTNGFRCTVGDRRGADDISPP